MKKSNEARMRDLAKKLLVLIMAFMIAFTGINFGGMAIGGAAKAYAAEGDAIPWNELDNSAGAGKTRIEFVSDGKLGNMLDGTTSITRYVDTSSLQSGVDITLPTQGDVGQPNRYKDQEGNKNYYLAGWVLVPHKNEYLNGDGRTYHSLSELKYFEPGATVRFDGSFKNAVIDEEGTNTEKITFYPDWQPISYSYGDKDDTALGGLRDDVYHGKAIRTDLYDYNALLVNLLNSHIGPKGNWNDNHTGLLFIDGEYSQSPTIQRPNVTWEVETEPGYTALVNRWTGSKGGAAQGLWNVANFSMFFDESTPGVTYVGNADEGPMYWYDDNYSEDNPYYGYYVYNSSESSAVYNQDKQRFYVYNDPQTGNGWGPWKGFLPFNKPRNEVYNSKAESADVPNYHFGMVTQVDFFLTGDVKDGTNKVLLTDTEGKPILDANGEVQWRDMEFFFSGDDDVFVFVDDTLALDIGGIHNATYGSINFATGEVKTTRSHGDGAGTPITNNDSIKDLKAGNHRLTIYYMERGSNETNNLTAFRLVLPATIKVKKIETQTGEAVVYPGTKFYLQNKAGEYYHLKNSKGYYYLKQDKYGLWYQKDGNLVLDSNESTDPLNVPRVSYESSKENACVFEADDEGAVEMRYVADGEYVLTETEAPEYYEIIPGSFGFKVENAKIVEGTLSFYKDGDYTSEDKPYPETETPEWADQIEVDGEEVTIKVSNDRKTHPIILTKNFSDDRRPEGIQFSFYEIKAPTIADKKIAEDENYDPTYTDKITFDKEGINKDKIPGNARLVYEGTTDKNGALGNIKWYPLGKSETPAEMVKPGQGDPEIAAPELKEGSVYYITEEAFSGDGNYYSMGAPVVVLVTDKGIELVSDTSSNKFVFENVETVNFEPAEGETPAALGVTNVPITIEEPEKFVNNEKAGTPFKDLTEEDKDALVKDKVITKDDEGYKKDGKLVGDDEVLIPALALEGRDKEFTYTVTQKIPAKATKVVITDVLKPELKIVGEPTIDSDEFTVSVDENTVTATTGDADKDLTALVDTVVTLTIVAKIRDGVTDAELIEKYGSTSVPNEATVTIGDKSNTTNKVTVTPPSTPEKSVSDADETDATDVTLKNRDEKFTYKVVQTVPAGATSATFEDVLAEVLEATSYEIDNDKFTATYDEETNTVRATATGTEEVPIVDKDTVVTLTIVAKIRDDVTDVDLIAKYGTTTVPNKAKVTINDKEKTTNEVKVTPPSDPVKSVSDNDETDVEHATLTNRSEQFTYKVVQTVPAGATSATFEDVLAEVLEATSYEIDNDKFTTTYDEETNTVSATATGTEENPIVDKDTVVTLTIVAKIRDGVTDAELIEKYGSTSVPNEATVTIGDKSNTTNKVTVTPPSTPEKSVSDDDETDATDVTLKNRNEQFTYKVVQTVPAGATSATFEDELAEVLEATSYEIDNDKFTVAYDEATNTVSATATGTEEAPIVDKDTVVTLTIVAKIKDGVTDAELIEKYGSTSVPNEATVTIGDKSNTTNKVTVTPPSTPEKSVSDEDETDATDVTLKNRNEEFTYKVVQTVPAGATSATFEDELAEVLDVVSYEIDNDKFTVAYDEATNTVSATATGTEEAPIVDKDTVVTLTIVAKIKDGVTDAELIEKYGSTSVPNEATVTIGDKSNTTNKVTVTPPSTPEKKINGGTERVELQNRPDTFTYTVTQTVPAGAIKVEFVDELESVLEVVGEPTINLEGATVTVTDNKVVASAKGDADNPVVDKDTIVTLTIVAKIRDEVTDDELIEKYGSTVVPNEATVIIDDKSKTTNTVEVTPPDEPGDEPEKKINGVNSVILLERPEVFTYTVSQKLPGDAKTALFEDVLEDVLEVVGTPTIDGAAAYTISVNGQTVTATSDSVIADRNKTVTLTIQAKIREGVTDEQLIEKYGSTSVPNKATITINGKENTTNTVEVTPPSNPDKKVNGEVAVELESRPAEFVYTITQLVPSAAKTVIFEDTLEDVLEVVGTPSIDGAADYTITIKDNKVTAATEDATADREKEVTLTIKAKIRDDVTDADLIAEYGSTTVPNKAKVTINDKPFDSNTVTVTPPDEPGSDPEKKVDSVLSLALGTRDQVFTYTVSQTFPGDAKTASFVDTLESVLEIVGEPTIDGKGLYEISVTGNKVIVVGTNVIADRNSTVTLTIKAKLRDDVTDEQLIARYGSTKVPNVAEITVNNNPKTTNEVEVTPPDSPREDPEKKINNQKELFELESRPETFTYTVSQAIPEGAKNVVFEDTLEDVLEVVGTPSMNCNDAVVSVNANKVEATIEDASGYVGQTLTLTIVAKIRDDVGDADLIAKYGSTTVPNKAVVTINDIPRTTNEVKVVPPVEDKEIVKTVNNAQHADLDAADEVFTYDIEVYVPADAEKMTITDKLVDELQFNTAADEVSVTVDGEEVKATKTIDGQLLTVDVVTSKPKTEATEESEEKEETDDATDDTADNAADDATDDAATAAADAAKAAAEKAAEAQAKADELETAAQAAEAAAEEAAAAAAEARAAADAAASDDESAEDEGTEEGGESTEGEGTEENAEGAEGEGTEENAEGTEGEGTEESNEGTEGEGEGAEEGNDAAALEEAAQAAEAAAEEAAKAAAEARAAADAAAEEAAAAATEAEAAKAAADKAAADKAATDDAATEGDEDAKEGSSEGEAAKTEEETATEEDDVVDLRGKIIKVTFQASIKAGADLSKYLDTNGSPRVPNTANYIVNDDPDRSYESNKVTVTPPTPPADEPEKTVNGSKDKLELANRTDTFVYTITQQMPFNAISAVFEDKVEDVLEVVSVEIDGNSTYTDETNGNLVRFTTGDASADRNNKVTMTITAKLRDGIADIDLIEKYGTTNVPNKATVTINGNPQATNEVIVTPPPVEPEDPIKKVNGKDKVSLANREEEFTYTISQKIPVGAVNVVFSDILEDVLEVKSATIDAEGAVVSINGQTVTATIADARALGNKIVVLTIKAKIKTSATEKELAAYTNREVPNVATVTIDGKGKVTNEVTVKPPMPYVPGTPGEPDPPTPDEPEPPTPDEPEPPTPDEPEPPTPEQPEPTPEQPEPTPEQPKPPAPEQPTPKSPILPSTGDESGLEMWITLLAIAIVAIGAVVTFKRRSSKK